MELFDVFKKRRSVRRFASRDVEEEKVQRILRAANSAPSAGNLQGYDIYFTRDPDRRRALAEAARGQTFVRQAPVCLVFCADPVRSAARYGSRGANLYSVQDATIACTYAMLAATELGLATTWVGAFNDDMVAEALGISGSDLVPVAILPVGYPEVEPERTPRRALADLVRDF